MRFRLVLLAAFLLLAGSAQAQINPWKSNKNAPRLADSDLPLLEQAGQKLLVEPAPAKGTTEAWTNEATGASGKVIYVGPTSQTVKGTKYACRKMKYEVTLKDNKSPRTTRASWCHMADGTWKLN